MTTGAEIMIQCQPTIAQVMEEEKNRARYEAIGWTHAFCCAALDDGKDPRQIDCAEIMAKARAQLNSN